MISATKIELKSCGRYSTISATTFQLFSSIFVADMLKTYLPQLFNFWFLTFKVLLNISYFYKKILDIFMYLMFCISYVLYIINLDICLMIMCMIICHKTGMLPPESPNSVQHMCPNGAISQIWGSDIPAMFLNCCKCHKLDKNGIYGQLKKIDFLI